MWVKTGTEVSFILMIRILVGLLPWLSQFGPVQVRFVVWDLFLDLRR
jgi:hypothetical protein